MAGFFPAIHAAPPSADPKLSGRLTTWMTGTSPVMTGWFPADRLSLIPTIRNKFLEIIDIA